MDDDSAYIQLAHELGALKNLPRTGWLRAGIKHPESVADHSWRVSILGMMLASSEGADPGRTSQLGLVHDIHEVRTGDIGPIGKRYLTREAPEAVVNDQVANLPEPMATYMLELVREYNEANTLEARCAQDADRLECLLQALEYAETGNTLVDHWVHDMHDRLVTTSGRRLADHARSGAPSDWWLNLSSRNPDS